jgi:putative flippase GtrA
MNIFKIKIKKILSEVGLLYVIVGFWNTLTGYIVGIVAYKILENYLHVTIIGLLSNIISITLAFLVYKIVVFKTNSNWLTEYFKSYVVYGISGVISILLLWLLIKYLGYNIWVSQAISMLVVISFSFFGNALYTFKKNV